MTTDTTTPAPREIDEVEALRKVAPLFERIFRVFDPKEFILRLSQFERGLYNKYFRGFRTEKFNRPKLAEIARHEIFDGNNQLLAQFVTILWNREHRDLYNDMLEQVKTVNEDVEAIELIPDDQAGPILEAVLAKGYEKDDVLLLVRLNDVRFSEEFILKNLPVEAAA